MSPVVSPRPVSADDSKLTSVQARDLFTKLTTIKVTRLIPEVTPTHGDDGNESSPLFIFLGVLATIILVAVIVNFSCREFKFWRLERNFARRVGKRHGRKSRRGSSQDLGSSPSRTNLGEKPRSRSKNSTTREDERYPSSAEMFQGDKRLHPNKLVVPEGRRKSLQQGMTSYSSDERRQSLNLSTEMKKIRRPSGKHVESEKKI